MQKRIDILGLGCTAVDELLYVDAYPAEDGKTPVRRRERQCGGLTATAMVAGARLGCRCTFAGTLGNDEASQFVVERFREEGIDVYAGLPPRGGPARPRHHHHQSPTARREPFSTIRRTSSAPIRIGPTRT